MKDRMIWTPALLSVREVIGLARRALTERVSLRDAVVLTLQSRRLRPIYGGVNTKVVWMESMIAAADYGATSANNKQFYAMKLGTTRSQAVLPTAATDRAVGILQNKPGANQAAEVMIMGISKAYSDGSGTSIAVGDMIGTSATGTLVKKATADYGVLGFANDPSSALGTIIEAWLLGGAGSAMFRTLLG